MKNENNDFEPQHESVVLTDKAKLSLYKKSANSGIPTGILEEVYHRGYNSWNPDLGYTPEQFGFDRVNSFIAGGFAVKLDEDLKKACWKGYEAIGMKMKNGKKVPNCVPVKEEDAETHSKNPDDSSSRFIGSDELVAIYRNETPGQVIKRVVREAALEEGDVIKTKFAVKNMQKRGIEGPHKIDADDVGGRAWGLHPVKHKEELVSYHGTTARVHGAGKHTDIEHGAVPMHDPRGADTKTLKNVIKKKTGNVVKIKEAALDVQATPAPTASSMGPSKLSRNARVELSRRAPAGGEGLRNVGANRYSASSPTNLSGKRLSTSTTATGKLTPQQRVSANQPAPKTASAPTSAPKPTASFGSSSRPTTVSATSGGVEKSGGFKLSSGMSDAGKAKVKPTAPVEVSAAAGKVAGALGKLARVATGPAATAAMTVMEPTPAGEKRSEFQRQSDVAKGISYKSQGRSVSQYEKDVLTAKPSEAPRPKVDAPTPPTRPEYFSRGQAFSAAREKAGGSTGQFTYDNKPFQTNIKSEPYVPAAKQKPTGIEAESGNVRKKIKEAIAEATYQGKKVKLNKPMKGDVKKSKVYVDPDGDGKAQKVNFGDPNMSIKKDQPARKKSYCARSSGQGNLTDKTSANYWSRRAWNCEETEVNELSVPAGTTGKRKDVSTPMVAVRMASGKIEKHPPGKSGSSGGGDE